jgi:hypothetical protein
VNLIALATRHAAFRQVRLRLRVKINPITDPIRAGRTPFRELTSHASSEQNIFSDTECCIVSIVNNGTNTKRKRHT